MKKYIILISIATVILFASCNKEEQKTAAVSKAPEEIVLQVEGELENEVETKTTAISTVAGAGTLYWGATTGTSTEAAKYSSTSATAAATIATGKYQTASPTAYNWYLSNVELSVGATTTVSASNTTDVICGLAESTTSTIPAITLNHIFARTGSLTTDTSVGSIEVSKYELTSSGANTGTAGTYAIKAGTWSSTTSLPETTITGSSDLYVIPGTYTLSVTGTYTRGDYTYTATKTGTVTLIGGKINNITAHWPAGGSAITVSVTLTSWSSQSVETTLS